MTNDTHRTLRLDLNRLSPDPAWPTQRQDLQVAVTILQRQAAAGEPLPLLEDWGQTAGGLGFGFRPGGASGCATIRTVTETKPTDGRGA